MSVVGPRFYSNAQLVCCTQGFVCVYLEQRRIQAGKIGKPYGNALVISSRMFIHHFLWFVDDSVEYDENSKILLLQRKYKPS